GDPGHAGRCAARRTRRGGGGATVRRDRGGRRSGRPFAHLAQVHPGLGAPRAQESRVIAPRRRYGDLVRDFRWGGPSELNCGQMGDAGATDRSRVALYWEDEAGYTARLTFWDVKVASNRAMNALAGLGVQRGDPVLIMLPRVPAWHAAVVGALKLGALVI